MTASVDIAPAPVITTGAVRKPRHRHLKRREEIRSVENIEVRSATSDAIVLTGTPIVYDTPYTVHGAGGQFSETVQRGAASHLLNSDVVLAWNHDTDAIPLARTSSGTLTLSDAPDGLHFEARLDPRNPAAVSLQSAIERGDVNQMSIGFSVAQDNWTGAGQTRARSISRFGSLIDISPVVWPASPTTSISVVQRAMLRAPDETLADLDRLYAEVRSGRVLSADNEQSLKTALQSVHDVLTANGFDTQSFLAGQDDDSDQEMDDEADEIEDEGEDEARAETAALALELELLQLRAAHTSRRKATKNA